MGFKFASFGAATVPLSKVIVDKDLDMGPYAIKGMYRPYTWETEALAYNDTTSRTVREGITSMVKNQEKLLVTWTCDSLRACYVRAIISTQGGTSQEDVASARIDINGETVYTTGSWPKGTTKTTDAIAISPGEVFKLYASNTSSTKPSYINNCSIVETGYEAPRNFDLKGRFLALEQDFGDLTATLTFGDEADVPFTDYPNRFPCAPTKITLSRHKLEDRPVINVYKEI